MERPEMTDSCLRVVVMEEPLRLPIPEDAAAADSYSGQKSMTKFAGVSAGHSGNNNRNWNIDSRRIVKSACILTMAVIGTVLGVHLFLLLSGPSKTRNYDHEHLQTVQLARADEMQVVSRASTSTYRSPQLFQVGGAGAVWTTPSTTDFFSSWAASVSFRTGDVLRFAGGTPGSSVLKEAATAYAACTTTAYSAYWTFSAGYDVYIQLIPVGTSYFMTDDAVACIGGLKMAPLVNSITVPPEPARPNVNVAQRSPQIFQVGGGVAATWTVPTTTNFYMDWASNISFIVGDIIEFTFTDSSLEVDLVPYSSYEACTTNGWGWYATSSAKYQFTTAGIKYFVAFTPQDCVQGMRFACNIYDDPTGASPPSTPSSSPPPPSPVAPPPPAPAVPPTSAAPTSAPTNPPSPLTPAGNPSSPPTPAGNPPSSRQAPPPTAETPSTSPFGAPATNSSSPPSHANVTAIAIGSSGGVLGVVLSVLYYLNKYVRTKPLTCRDINCFNINNYNSTHKEGHETSTIAQPIQKHVSAPTKCFMNRT